MAISETTVRPTAALWHPCHRGIRESIHIRRAVEHPRMDSLRVGEQIPWFTDKPQPKEPKELINQKFTRSQFYYSINAFQPQIIQREDNGMPWLTSLWTIEITLSQLISQ